MFDKEANKTVPYAKALKEAQEFVEKLSPIGVLKYSEELTTVCKTHCADLIKYGVVEHTGSDGHKLEERLREAGTFTGEVGETLLSGRTGAEDFVISMIVDGTQMKEQRKNLFNPAFKVCGVEVKDHHKLKNIAVINYAESYKKK